MAEEAELGITRMPHCVGGGGQGGIALAARLKRLGAPTIILDKHPRPGDHWRKRPKSLHLQDPVRYDHLPYIPFPDHWPVFAAKDKIGDWLESCTKVMDLNYWSNSECISARFDEASKRHRLLVDERLGGKAHQPGGRRQGRQGYSKKRCFVQRIWGDEPGSCATAFRTSSPASRKRMRAARSSPHHQYR